MPFRMAVVAGMVAAAALLGLLWLLSPILLPFVAGMALAYFLDPLVDRCEQAGLGRALATTLVLFVAILTALGAVLLLLPVALDQAASFAVRLPELGAGASRAVERAMDWVSGQAGMDMGPIPVPALPESLGAEIGGWAMEALAGAFRSGVAIVNLVALALVTPVVTWYLLRDWDTMVARIDSLLPRAGAETIRSFVRELDSVLASFVRGQSIVCAVLAGFYALALGLLGVPNGVFIGLFAGLVAFVPYVGSGVGLLLSVGVAALEFGLAWQTIGAAAIFMVGQALEDYGLRPRLIGERVGLHPVWTLFALFAGGTLFGFVGILLAVPAAAALAVLFRAGIARYRASRLYGEESS